MNQKFNPVTAYTLKEGQKVSMGGSDYHFSHWCESSGSAVWHVNHNGYRGHYINHAIKRNTPLKDIV